MCCNCVLSKSCAILSRIVVDQAKVSNPAMPMKPPSRRQCTGSVNSLPTVTY